MFTNDATVSRKSSATRLNRSLTASACAIALAVLLSSNVAAIPLARDDERHAPIITPKLELVSGWNLLRFKLATTEGYRILAFG